MRVNQYVHEMEGLIKIKLISDIIFLFQYILPQL